MSPRQVRPPVPYQPRGADFSLWQWVAHLPCHSPHMSETTRGRLKKRDSDPKNAGAGMGQAGVHACLPRTPTSAL